MPRSGEHYMPRPDAAFSAWANHYYDAVKAWWDAQGLDAGGLSALDAALAEWKNAYPAHIAARAAAEGACAAKDAARAALAREVRPITNFVQGFPATTDAERAAIGITVRPPHGTPAQTPTTAPMATVDGGQRLAHTLRFVDSSTPTRTARPKGVLGAEVWVKLMQPNGQMAKGKGPNPEEANAAAPEAARALGDPASFSFLTLATRPSITAEFRAGDGGKTAVYMLRWVSTRGEKGPWSEVASATVAA